MVFDKNRNMKKMILAAMVTFLMVTVKAQDAATADTVTGKVTVIKDSRIEVLASKQAASSGTGGTGGGVSYGPRAAKGYRLMIINTNDRDLAMRVRSQLLQRFPEQKVYMLFKPPYIQIKFGNFVEKGEADRYKTLVRKGGIVSTNVYAVPEIVEVKPSKEGEKDKEKEKDRK
jgi:hypothetical protein